MNVLLVLEDALRPRNMSCYGYGKPTTPNCDRLAAEGVRFETCIAVSAHTFPPIVSLLTGQTPFTHGLMTPKDYARWRNPEVAEKTRVPLRELAAHGYRVDGELVTRWAPLGFDRDSNDLEAYLGEHRRDRWFYMAEPYPTHLPYDPPQAYYELFVDADFRPDAASRERLDTVRSRMILHPPDVISAMEAGEKDSIGSGDEAHRRSVATVEFRPEDEPGIRALYDGEVRVFDDMVGRWLKMMESLGILDDTLIIITADHGEELLERGHVGHSSCNLKGTLHDECIHVPLIMRCPGRLPAGRVISQQVSQIDLMPTIFDVLGLEMPAAVDGASLLPLIEGREQSFREEACAETPPAGWQALSGDDRRIWCLRTAEWKLIVHHDLSDGRERSELYCLSRDPGERRNVIQEEPGIARRLRDDLEKWRKGDRHETKQVAGRHGVRAI